MIVPANQNTLPTETALELVWFPRSSSPISYLTFRLLIPFPPQMLPLWVFLIKPWIHAGGNFRQNDASRMLADIFEYVHAGGVRNEEKETKETVKCSSSKNAKTNHKAEASGKSPPRLPNLSRHLQTPRRVTTAFTGPDSTLQHANIDAKSWQLISVTRRSQTLLVESPIRTALKMCLRWSKIYSMSMRDWRTTWKR